MHNIEFALSSGWKVLLVSLVLGAGLPALFALGIRALSSSARPTVAGVVGAARPVGRVLGGLCFSVVLMAVATGITFIVATGSGKTLSFEHGYPTIVAKR